MGLEGPSMIAMYTLPFFQNLETQRVNSSELEATGTKVEAASLLAAISWASLKYTSKTSFSKLTAKQMRMC